MFVMSRVKEFYVCKPDQFCLLILQPTGLLRGFQLISCSFYFFSSFFLESALFRGHPKVPRKLARYPSTHVSVFALEVWFPSLYLIAGQIVIERFLFTYLLLALQQVQHPENIVKKTIQHFLPQQLILMFPWSIQHMFSARKGHMRIAGLSFIPYNVLPTTNIVKHWYAFTTNIHK